MGINYLLTCSTDKGVVFPPISYICKQVIRPLICLYSLSMGYLNTCYIQCSLHNHFICKTEARYWWCISQVSWNSNFHKFGEICPLFLCRDTQYYFHRSYCKKLSRLFRFAKFRSVISLDKFGPTGFLSMFNINDIYDYKSFHFNIFVFFLKEK